MEQLIYNIDNYQQAHPLTYILIIALFVGGLMLIMSARRNRKDEETKYREFLKKYDK